MNDFDDTNYNDNDDDVDNESVVSAGNLLNFHNFNISGNSFARNNMDLDEVTDPKALIPGPPRDLVAQIINPRLVALSWLEPLINPDEVTSYSIFYKINTSER